MKNRLIKAIAIPSVIITIILMYSITAHKMATSQHGYQHDYQLDATPKGYILYSGPEKIGFIPAGNSTLDSLIQNHNQ